MTLPNPGNDSPLSYGILAYGTSATEMPIGSTFSGNEIYGVAGAAISLGSYTYSTTITGNNLHDIIPVDFLGEQLSTGVQSEFAAELTGPSAITSGCPSEVKTDSPWSRLVVVTPIPG